MTDSASPPPISEEAAELIERTVRDEISPEQRMRLEALIEADPAVAGELERAKREEGAMNTAAMLLTEQSDPERMRRAIEQKLGLDLRMILTVGVSLIVGIPVYMFMLYEYPQHYSLVVWIGVVPLTPLLVYLALNLYRWRALRRALSSGGPALENEFSRHLSRSRNEHTIARAGLIIAYIAMPLMIIEDLVSGNHARAIVLAVFYLTLLGCGWKTAFSRRQQDRFDKFFEGRLTLEEMFDKQHPSNEPDGE